MGQRQGVDAAHDIESVAREDGVEPAVPHGPLPLPVTIVLRDGPVQRGRLRRQGAGAVAHGVAPQHADALDACVGRRLSDQLQRVPCRAARPGREWMKAMNLVEEHPLRAFEDDRSRDPHGLGERFIGRDHVVPPESRDFGDPSVDHAVFSEDPPLPLSARGSERTETRASIPAHLLSRMRPQLGGQPVRMAQIAGDDALVRSRSEVLDGFTHPHATRAVARGAARDLAEAVRRLVEGCDDAGPLADPGGARADRGPVRLEGRGLAPEGPSGGSRRGARQNGAELRPTKEPGRTTEGVVAAVGDATGGRPALHRCADHERPRLECGPGSRPGDPCRRLRTPGRRRRWPARGRAVEPTRYAGPPLPFAPSASGVRARITAPVRASGIPASLSMRVSCAMSVARPSSTRMAPAVT